MRQPPRLPLLLAIAAIAAILLGWWQLAGLSEGVVTTRTSFDGVPATVFRADAAGPAPVVVIAHGFAGSQQLMLPFALTLARNGYVAVTFDFPGHGRNPVPMRGGLTDDAAASRSLLDALEAVMSGTRQLGDGRLALLGHSMAADILVRHAETDPSVDAMVAVSLFTKGVTATAPRNLLIVDGALEPAMLIDDGYRIIRMAGGADAQPGVTYGSFADGTARRLALADGSEHIGVLYDSQSLTEALAWLDAAFTRQGSGAIDRRGGWLGLLFLGLVALAWPLSRLLPAASPVPVGSGLRWRWILAVAGASAVLTPILLTRVPTAFLPILLGDYLAVHFALYGMLTALGLWLLRSRQAGRTFAASWKALAVGVIALAGYGLVALGVPLDRFVTSVAIIPERIWLIFAVLAGLLPWFLADEWLVRGPGSPRGAYAATKLLFVGSLALAIVLAPQRLFFLAIIVPVILIFFTVLGLFSGWSYRATRHPFVAAMANAIVLACAIAVTFPMIAR